MDIKLLKQALGQVWLISEFGAQHYAELLHLILNGATITAGLFDDTEPPYRANSQGMKNVNGEVLVLPIDGIMMKNDYCGSMGTDTMSRMINAANKDRSIQSIVLKINSPGGSVNGTENLANTIKASSKPIVSWSEMMASAAYWAGSGASEIIISGETAMIGSIGTMSTMRKNTASDEKKGYKDVVMFAARSVHKNRAAMDALDGKPEAYISEILNPLNDAFENSVSANRAGKIDLKKEDVLTGKVYIGSTAVKVGLADSVGSLDQAIKKSLQIAKTIK